MKYASFTGLVFLLLTAQVCADEAVLTLFYAERPPYQYRASDGRVLGLTAEPAAAALSRAHIPYVWKLLSAKRELQVIRDNQEAACLVGWFQRPERLTYAFFSLPIYRDRPPVLIAGRNYESGDIRRFDQLLALKSPRLLVKDVYSYGAYIDELLRNHAALRVVTGDEQPQMLQQIQRARADLMFLSGEEADYLATRLSALGLKVLNFEDLQQGESRHLMCSRKTPAAWIQRINAQIHSAQILSEAKP